MCGDGKHDAWSLDPEDMSPELQSPGGVDERLIGHYIQPDQWLYCNFGLSEWTPRRKLPCTYESMPNPYRTLGDNKNRLVTTSNEVQ